MFARMLGFVLYVGTALGAGALGWVVTGVWWGVSLATFFVMVLMGALFKANDLSDEVGD